MNVHVRFVFGLKNWSAIYVLLQLANLVNCARAVVTSDDPANHRVRPGQAVYGVNLDGVAMIGLIGFAVPATSSIADVEIQCSGALISDRYILTVAHCFDLNRDGQVDDEQLLFSPVAAFELAGQTVLAPIDVQQIQFPETWPQRNADVAVVELMLMAPAEIPRYPIYAGDDEVGRQVVIAGYGRIGWGATGVDPVVVGQPQQKHAGLNRIDGALADKGAEFLVSDFDSGLPEHNLLAQIGIDSDLGLGLDEAHPAFGDSGGPLLIDGAIGAVTSFGNRLPSSDITDTLDASWGEVAFGTRVSSYRSFIDATTNHSARFVGLVGDFNETGQLDADDLDHMTTAIRIQTSDARFDLDGNGRVESPDRRFWIHELAHTFLGDSNLDGEFNTRDLVSVFQADQYEDSITSNSNWETGDWNGDSDFTTNDLMVAFEDGGYETGPRVGGAVPEPKSFLMLLTGTLAVAYTRMQRHR